MIGSSLQKIIVAVITIGLFIWFAYNALFKAPPAPLPANGATPPPAVGQDILVLIDQLKAATVDQSLFTSPLFVNLKDFNVPTVPEIQGRSNPFAPIGGDSGGALVSAPTPEKTTSPTKKVKK